MANEEEVDVTATQENGNEGGGEETVVDTISVAKADYEKMNQTLGSLKRELKDLRKSKEETKETKDTTSKPDDNGLLQKAFLRSAQITDSEEVELALSTAKKWGVTVDQLVDDEDFKSKLDKHRTAKANIAATSNIRGSAGTSQAKLTPAFWEAKGTRPTAADIPNRTERVKVIRAMMGTAKNGGGKFYNE